MEYSYEEALIAMGYRKIKDSGVWAKPVAFMLFVYSTELQQWKSIIRGTSGQPLVWDSYTLSSNAIFFLSNIKEFERHVSLNVGSYDTNFESISMDEYLKLKLDW